MKKTNLWLAFFCNAIFLLYGLHYVLPIHNFTLSILINLIIFIIPGIGWMGMLKEKIKDSIMLVFFTVCFSLGILILGLVGHYVIKLKPESFTFLIYLFAVTNIGIFLSGNSATLKLFMGKKKEFFILIVCSFLIYGYIYYGAERLPGLVDIDLEIPGSTYGLLYVLKPYQTSDISPLYFYFCHPPLTNLYSAFGVLFLDKAQEFKFYYDSAKTAERTFTGNPENDTRIAAYLAQEDRKVFSQNQKKLVFAGRMANIFISLLVFWAVFKLTLYLTGSQAGGLCAGLLYVSFPGIFVRSSTAYYLPLTNYGFLILAHQYIAFGNDRMSSMRKNMLMFLPGIFAGLVNQKILVLIIAIALLNIIRIFYYKRKGHLWLSSILDVPIIGYMLGMAVYWIYGFIIDKHSFILCHIQMHFLDRIFHLRQIYSAYPSIWKLWREFQIEFPLFILTFPALTFLWKKYIQRKEGVLILWFLVGALSFSIVDWKQTRHLMNLVPALVILFMVFVVQQEKWRKGVWIFILMCALVYSLWFDMKVLHNFTFYRPTPDW